MTAEGAVTTEGGFKSLKTKTKLVRSNIYAVLYGLNSQMSILFYDSSVI